MHCSGRAGWHKGGHNSAPPEHRPGLSPVPMGFQQPCCASLSLRLAGKGLSSQLPFSLLLSPPTWGANQSLPHIAGVAYSSWGLARAENPYEELEGGDLVCMDFILTENEVTIMMKH